MLGPVSPPVLSELLIVPCAPHGSRGRVSSIATQGDHLVVWAVRRMTGPDAYEVKTPDLRCAGTPEVPRQFAILHAASRT